MTRRHQPHWKGRSDVDLKTEYLGMVLPNPLVAGASPLSDDIDGVNVQAQRQRERRIQLRAIEDGLLRRSLLTATRPG